MPNRKQLAVLLAVLVLAGLGGALWWHRSGPTPPPTQRLSPEPPVPSLDATVAAPPDVSPPPALQPAERSLPGTWVDVAPSLHGDGTAQGDAKGAAAIEGTVVVGLHGRGDTAEHFSAIASRLGPRFRWRFLQAPLPMRPGNGPQGHEWFRMDAPDGGRADLQAALPLVHQHVRALGANKVAVVGFSQGAFVAAQLAAQHPELVHAVVVIGGGLLQPPDQVLPGPRPAVVFVHGTDDMVVPLATAKQAAQALDNRGFSTEFLEHADGHVLPEPEIERLREWLVKKLK